MVTPGTPPIPHVGGPISGPCSPNVIIGGLPAARVTDMAVCVGPQDTIVKGSPTVHINGLLAARIGDNTAHGGVIVMGFPTVIIGDVGRGSINGMAVAMTATGTITVGNAITISGPLSFQEQVLDRLALIATTKAGQQTMQAIDSSKHSMNIIPFAGDNSFCGPNPTWADLQGQTAKGQAVYDGNGHAIIGPNGKTQLMGTGKGANTTLQLNPNLTLDNPLDAKNPMPNDAVLFHEMTHGAHQMNGQADTSPQTGGWDTHEEQNTISTGSPSEADYLKERGYPYQRTDHDSTFAPNGL
jgi:uncharacterized Zn-binding protein involved in type VI secretion